jgi:Ca-activated chloride channel family protein
MIHFEHIEYLWLLVAVVLLGVLWGYGEWRRRRRLEQWADKGMFGRLIPDRSRWRPVVKMSLTLLGLALLVVALANPQFGTRMEKGKRAGSDVAICLDLSNSMLAEDIQPNRLERSKRVVGNLLNSFAGDRVSLVAFAGTSFIQMPLTADYGATKLFLDEMDCSMISEQGTAIGDAIEKAMLTLGYGDEDREWVKGKNRAIIVISDGENHEDDAVGAARNAAKEGVRVCTVGMGLPEGSPIPEFDSRGRRNNYKRDREGNVIMTHLNEQMLRDVASAGDGVYVRAGNVNSGLSDITNLIQGLDKEEFGEAQFAAYESRYMYPLVAGLLCLLAEVLVFERRNRKWNVDKLLRSKGDRR